MWLHPRHQGQLEQLSLQAALLELVKHVVECVEANMNAALYVD